MPSYSPEERDQIVREFFRAERLHETLCPLCGDEIRLQLDYESNPGDPHLRVRCGGCGGGFLWRQTKAPREWKPLYLAYFSECHRKGRVFRCPIDDSSVICREFDPGILEFRCPYCNRFGRVSAKKGTDSRASS